MANKKDMNSDFIESLYLAAHIQPSTHVKLNACFLFLFF